MANDIAPAHGFSPGTVRYAIGLIFLVSVFNVCDRTIMSVLVPEIRTDLGLNDRDLGLLMGPAFAVVHILAGIPIARLADRKSRRTIIAIGLFAWSLLTIMQGMARSFGQLLVARMGVGIGEAAGSPPSHALLADLASVSMRARALSFLQVGSLVGMGIGTALGGTLNELWGWRAAFFAVGFPGLLLAILVFFTLPEPPRGASEGVASTASPGASEGTSVNASPSGASGESLFGALRHLLRTPTYAWMLAGVSAAGVVGVGRNAWEPTFLREVYGMGSADAGIVYFLISPLPSAVGTLAGAWLTDALGRRDQRWYFWIPALGSLISVPCALAFLLWPESHHLAGIPVAFYFSVLLSLAATGAMPAILAMGQSLAPARMRAFSAALWSMIFTFVGMGLGPFFVGDLIERLRPEHGDEAIRFALSAASVLPLLAAVLYGVASRTVVRDIERARSA